jgi:MGT family glycosyltransferase
VLIECRYRRDGLPPLNRARHELGLAPLRSPFEQYDRIARVLILSSAAFDIPPDPLPANVRYVGSPVERSSAATWRSPWRADDPRPLVLVSLSTLPQGQGPVLKRALAAVSTLPVRALVTLGPSLDRAQFTAPPNAVLEAFVPHDVVMPLASAMITQCGLGTLAKALSVGLPLVCLPLLADQPANAALVAAHGAGVRLHHRASPAHIARAVQHVLTEPRFRAAAGRLASHMANEDGAQRAAGELEALAPPMPARRHRN